MGSVVSDRSLVSPVSMRAFIVCLAIAFVSGDAKPYTLKQVAEGLPVKNAIADRRLHHLGKREAEPYTLGQVAAGQTAGGEITAIDFGHGTGLQPAKEVKLAATHVVAPV